MHHIPIRKKLTALGLSCGMWDLVPWPGIEPQATALGLQSLRDHLGSPPFFSAILLVYIFLKNLKSEWFVLKPRREFYTTLKFQLEQRDTHLESFFRFYISKILKRREKTLINTASFFWSSSSTRSRSRYNPRMVWDHRLYPMRVKEAFVKQKGMLTINRKVSVSAHFCQKKA